MVTVFKINQETKKSGVNVYDLFSGQVGFRLQDEIADYVLQKGVVNIRIALKKVFKKGMTATFEADGNIIVLLST